MKLLLLIILLCGITPGPGNTPRSKKKEVSHSKLTPDYDIVVPAGLLFQF